MSGNGDPYENAIAERVNGILKGEFLLDKTFASFAKAQHAVESAVNPFQARSKLFQARLKLF